MLKHQEKILKRIAVQRGVYKKGRKNYSYQDRKWERGIEKFILDSFENDSRKFFIHKSLIIDSTQGKKRGYILRELFRLFKDLDLYNIKSWHYWNDGYYPETVTGCEEFKNFLLNNSIMKSILQPGRVVTAHRLYL
jgi:hypothetical protein